MSDQPSITCEVSVTYRVNRRGGIVFLDIGIQDGGDDDAVGRRIKACVESCVGVGTARLEELGRGFVRNLLDDDADD